MREMSEKEQKASECAFSIFSGPKVLFCAKSAFWHHSGPTRANHQCFLRNIDDSEGVKTAFWSKITFWHQKVNINVKMVIWCQRHYSHHFAGKVNFGGFYIKIINLSKELLWFAAKCKIYTFCVLIFHKHEHIPSKIIFRTRMRM